MKLYKNFDRNWKNRINQWLMIAFLKEQTIN